MAYPSASFLFSRRATIGIIIFVYVFGYLVTWFADYYLPCCQFYLYYGSYSYTFLDTDYNVANIFVDTPVNIITSVIAVLNYVIVCFITKANSVLNSLNLDLCLYSHIEPENKSRSNQVHSTK